MAAGLPMFRGRRVAVIVPAFNEADKIARTIRSVPGFVDHVIVIDDASTDATLRVALRSQRRGMEIISHDANRGVGAALVTGYGRAYALGADVTAVMAGDSQMDPADLSGLVAAVASGQADYAKGNRFAWPGGFRAMPKSRLLGNLVLSFLTRIASGYTHIFDSQCGYTAANRTAVAAILSVPVFARYGYPNDLLARLAAVEARVVDVAVRPVYGPQWRSGIRITRVIFPISFLLARGLAHRLQRAVGRLAVRSWRAPSAPRS